MHGTLPDRGRRAISASAASNISRQDPAAASCRDRQHLAEPLWFAVMCRALFGTNATKELQFLLGRSERTCRAWASGDSEPPASVLAALICSEHGWPVLKYLLGEITLGWWGRITRATRIVDQIDQIDFD